MTRHLHPVGPDPMSPCTQCHEVHTRCKGHRRDKQPCTQWPVKGTRVCKMHGGMAPQVQRTARQRLLEAADPAAALLTQFVQDETLSPSDRLKAALAVLDRAGHAPGVKVGQLEDEGAVNEEIERLLATQRGQETA